MTIEDEKGNKLKKILLQVVDADEQGPRTLVIRRDHEKIDLSDPKARKFIIVYAPEDEVLGELRLTDLIEEFDKIKALAESRQTQKASLDRQIEALVEDCRVKTGALRALQRERDPNVIAKAIQDAVTRSTESLTEQLSNIRGLLMERDREVRDLKESKRRLKEANERLKEGKR